MDYENTCIYFISFKAHSVTLDLSFYYSSPHRSQSRCRPGLLSSPEADETVELLPAGSQCSHLNQHLMSTAQHRSRNQSKNVLSVKDDLESQNQTQRHSFKVVQLLRAVLLIWHKIQTFTKVLAQIFPCFSSNLNIFKNHDISIVTNLFATNFLHFCPVYAVVSENDLPCLLKLW